MTNRRLFAASLIATTLLGAGLIAGMGQPGDKKTEAKPAAASASAGAYSVDPVHSSVVFKIRHNGVANFYGRFNKSSGSFNWDPAKPDAASADITIDAASIDTGVKKRDDHLNSPDFFNTKEFPTVTFKSKSMKKSGDAWEMTGDLTMHGTTKEVAAKFIPIGEKTGDKGSLAGFEVQFKVLRSQFGMTYGIDAGGLGDDVQIMASFEGKK